MGEYSKFISEKRRPIPSPPNIVNADGSCEFGTFQSEFKEMDFLKLKKPTRAPEFMTKRKLTMWQATEVHFKEGILLAAVCHMGFFGLVLNVFFDKRTKKVFSWSTNLSAKKTIIAPNLLNSSVSEGNFKDGFVKVVNNFGCGKCLLSGAHKSNKGNIEYDFELNRISLPSVVSIPFGPNRPLYSQKDLFRAEGKLRFNGEEFATDENSVAVADDHRGFYPRKMHFDWVTTLGRELNGSQNYFAFNLTQNQSTNPVDYNENLIWLENRISLLPPVRFERNFPTKKQGKSVDNCEWYVKDEHDMVNLTFFVDDAFRLEINALIVRIEYYITFGQLKGYLRDEEGEKYTLDGLTGMGEDKTMLF